MRASRSPRHDVGISNQLFLAFLILVFAASWSSSLGWASPRDWVGSAACGACHPKQLAAWQATPHASTRARFLAKPEARCLACHGTGEAPAGRSVVEVGCEACHGA